MITRRIILFIAIVGMLIAPAYAITTEVQSMDEPEVFILCDSEKVHFLLVNPTGSAVSVTNFAISTQGNSVELAPFVIKRAEIARITVNLSLPAELRVDSNLQYDVVDEPGIIGRALGSEPESVVLQKTMEGDFAITPSGTYREDINVSNDFEIHDSDVDIKICEGVQIVAASHLIEPMMLKGGVGPYLWGYYVQDHGVELHIFNPSGHNLVWKDMVLFKKSHMLLPFANPEEIPDELLPSGQRFWDVDDYSIDVATSYDWVSKKSDVDFSKSFRFWVVRLVPITILLCILAGIVWWYRRNHKD